MTPDALAYASACKISLWASNTLLAWTRDYKEATQAELDRREAITTNQIAELEKAVELLGRLVTLRNLFLAYIFKYLDQIEDNPAQFDNNIILLYLQQPCSPMTGM